jgi:hypothetical protein
MKTPIGQGTGDERKHEQGNRLEHAGKDYWQRIAGKGDTRDRLLIIP